MGLDPSKGLLINYKSRETFGTHFSEAIKTSFLENVEEKGRLPAFHNGFGIVPGESRGLCHLALSTDTAVL